MQFNFGAIFSMFLSHPIFSVTHAALPVTELKDATEIALQVDVIGIDEGQFVILLYSFCSILTLSRFVKKWPALEKL